MLRKVQTILFAVSVLLTSFSAQAAEVKLKVDKIHPPRWEDVVVPFLATTASGARAPHLEIFKNDGVNNSTGYAVSFDGTNDYAIIKADEGDFGAAFSLTFWMNTSYSGGAARHIIFKTGNFNVAMASSRIQMNLTGLATVQTSAIALGVLHHVAITVSAATNPTVIIYVDGVANVTTTLTGTLAADTTNLMTLGGNAASTNLQVILDELKIHQSVLTAANVAASYNGGAGTETPVTAAILGWHFNEGSGTNAAEYVEGGGTHDLTLTNGPTWVTGYIDTGGSRGVLSYHFSPLNDSEVYFTAQLPHSYKEGSLIKPHIHWTLASATNCNVRWELEYSIREIDGAFGNTTLAYVNAASNSQAYRHNINYFNKDSAGSDWAGISGNLGLANQVNVSAVIVGRIGRNGTNVLDTCTADEAIGISFDFHIQIDSVGSDADTSKLGP